MSCVQLRAHPRQRVRWCGGCAGRGGGGVRGRAGGGGRGSAVPTAAPTPLPAYMQPLKFVSSGAMHPDEERTAGERAAPHAPPVEQLADAVAAASLEGADLPGATGASAHLALRQQHTSRELLSSSLHTMHGLRERVRTWAPPRALQGAYSSGRTVLCT